MRITDIEALHLRIPDVGEICDGTQDALLVRVHTDVGLIGLGQGEGAPHAIMAAIDAPISNSIGRGLREAAVGEDPREVERVTRKLLAAGAYVGTQAGAGLAAVCAVEMALWDLLGKATGLPLYVLLGGAHRKRVPAYASTLFPEADESDPVRVVTEKASRIRERGFRAMKFGFGRFGRDPTTDVAMVRALRLEAGSDGAVMVDAGLCWHNAADAIEAARQLEDFHPYWIEDPFARPSIEACRRLASAVPTRIAVGVRSAQQAREMITHGNVSVVQADVGSVGVSACKQIGLGAVEVGGTYVPHCYGTGVIQAATLHLLASLPYDSWLELPFEASVLSRDLLTEPVDAVDGMVGVPQAPGLGIELNEDVVERYLVERSAPDSTGVA
jgi:L-rhamnonate dehydratase